MIERKFGTLVASTAVITGAAIAAIHGLDTTDVTSEPKHAEDITALTKFTSPQGDSARCDTTASIDFQRGLHQLAEDGQLAEPDIDLFYAVLSAKGMRMGEGRDARPLEREDLVDLTKADLSSDRIPGFDCGEPEGASTFVVIDTLEKHGPFVLGGAVGSLMAFSAAVGSRFGRRGRK